MENHFLNGSGEEETVHENGSLLSESPAACDRLGIDGGVPRGFEKNHARCAGDVESDAAGACGEEEEAFRREACVEGVDHGLSLRDVGAPVESEEVPVVVLAEDAEEVEDLGVGGDDEEEFVGCVEDLLDEALYGLDLGAVVIERSWGGVMMECIAGWGSFDGVG